MLSLLANYIIFSKMGEEGFKSLVPFYNRYTLYKKTWDKAMFWVLFAIKMLEILIVAVAVVSYCSLASGFRYYSYYYGHGRLFLRVFPSVMPGLLVLIPLSIGEIVIKVLGRWHLCKSFGGGKLFCVFSIFFPTFFRYVLGFDRNYRYAGNATTGEAPDKSPRILRKKNKAEEQQEAAPAGEAPSAEPEVKVGEVPAQYEPAQEAPVAAEAEETPQPEEAPEN